MAGAQIMKHIGYRLKKGRGEKYPPHHGPLECAKRREKLAAGKLSDGGWHTRLLASIAKRVAP